MSIRLASQPKFRTNNLRGFICPVPLFSWHAVSTALPAGNTYTRASTGAVVDNLGQVWQAATGWPRFQGARIADPLANGQLVYYSTDAGGASINPAAINLLMESARTNVLLQSEATDPTAIPGVKSSGAVVTAESMVTPSGSTASVMCVRFDLSLGSIAYIRAGSLGTFDLVFSVFVKPIIGGTQVKLSFSWSQVGTNYASANLVDGTITGFGNVTADRCGIVRLSGGWFRLWVAGNNTGDPSTRRAQIGWTIDGDKIALWGFQIETGVLTPSSYIRTSGAATTRAVDALTFSGVPPDNETRMVINSANVNIDDWNGVYTTPVIPELVNSITAYYPGQRPLS